MNEKIHKLWQRIKKEKYSIKKTSLFLHVKCIKIQRESIE